MDHPDDQIANVEKMSGRQFIRTNCGELSWIGTEGNPPAISGDRLKEKYSPESLIFCFAKERKGHGLAFRDLYFQRKIAQLGGLPSWKRLKSKRIKKKA